VPPILASYKPVTPERPSVRRRRLAHGQAYYDGVGLQPARSDHASQRQRGCGFRLVFSTGVTNGHEAPPIVNNGVMFIATPGNQVVAIGSERADCCGATVARRPRT
jgi:alcohol dehydrogenase (cytochrome c)